MSVSIERFDCGQTHYVCENGAWWVTDDRLPGWTGAADTQAECEALRREAMVMKPLNEEIARLTRERNEAREALAPFAEYALALEDRFGRESVLPAGAKIGHPGPVLCVMDFRRAYRAYAVGGVSGTAGTGTIGDSFTEKSSRDATVSIDGASQPQGGSE